MVAGPPVPLILGPCGGQVGNPAVQETRRPRISKSLAWARTVGRCGEFAPASVFSFSNASSSLAGIDTAAAHEARDVVRGASAWNAVLHLDWVICPILSDASRREPTRVDASGTRHTRMNQRRWRERPFLRDLVPTVSARVTNG